MGPKVSTLSNGVKVVSDYMASAESLVLGIWVGVGTRHEPKSANGIAHMTEHMLFKGTQKRSAYALSTAIEKNGGSMNAYTTREETAYYARIMPEDAELAADIISDMLLNSLFAPKEIAREKQVIIQEIGRDQDTPEDYVYDLMHETAFPNQTIGRPILGRTSVIQNMPRETLLAYTKKHYHAGNIVIVGTGKIEHEQLVDIASRYFADIPRGRKSTYEKAKIKSGELRKEKDSQQLHLMLSFPAPHLHTRNTHDASLLGLILGGSSSSRLFQKVRERKGLVYHISASHMAFDDTGLLNIYAGTDPERVGELMPIICKELIDVCHNIRPSELSRTKAGARADILMGQESVMRRAESLGHQMLRFGKPLSLEKNLQKIMAATADDIQAMANTIFSRRPILTALGPTETIAPYAQILQWLSL